MIKLLVGGSPCTHWSIARTTGRETEASGIGWELFRNYLIAKQKWKPDFFLYENNVSASEAIKEQIRREFGVTEGTSLFSPDNGVRYTEINSALVSAQNRKRFYVTNFGDIEQPKDRGILLMDVLDGAVAWRDKSYTVDGNYWRTTGPYDPGRQCGRRLMAAEPVFIEDQRNKKTGKREFLAVSGGKSGTITTINTRRQCAEPVLFLRDNEMDYMVQEPKNYKNRWGFLNKPGECEKAKCVVSNYAKGVPYNVMAEPIQIMRMPREDGTVTDSKQYRVYSICGKAVTQCGEGGGLGAKTGLYAIPVRYVGDATEFDGDDPVKGIDPNGIEFTIYRVKNGRIKVKGEDYPIKLQDGYYIIRKLSVSECARLQTIPEWFQFPVSKTQAYRQLGNGWTVEVIKHLLSHIPGIYDDQVEVLSLYDGMSCGQIALREMGVNVAKYTAYEIDKYAIQTTQFNFPDTIQRGDAFQVREEGWIP